MAENIRSIELILHELFMGRDSALRNYAKVRRTQYWMGLWCNNGWSLQDIDATAKAYFSKRFLNGVLIKNAGEKALRDAFTRLDHAVVDGCHGRCSRIVNELNAALAELGLQQVDVDKFLDWLTFNYYYDKYDDGSIKYDDEYGTPIRIFNDDQNLREFWSELQLLLKSGRMASMQYVASIVVDKRKKTKPLKNNK